MKCLLRLFKRKPKLVYPHRDNWSQWDNFEKELLDCVNKERISRGIPILIPDETLQLEAENRAIHYRELGELDKHIGFSAINCRLTDLGAKVSGENLAIGYQSAETTVHAWMNSSGHRDLILNKGMIYCGMGFVRLKKKTFECMITCK